MKSQSTHTLDSSAVATRLGLCAAAIAGMAAAPSVQADVITVTPSTPISIPANIDGVYINLLNSASGSSGSSAPGWDVNIYLTNSVLTFFWPSPSASAGGVASATTGGTYTDLAAGATVSSASIFSLSSGGGGAGSTISFQTAGTHILGIRFLNEVTAVANYGYLTLQTGASAGFPATITSWSYDNTGAAITVASPVPEPASGVMLSLGALALGAVSLRRMRRARRDAAH